MSRRILIALTALVLVLVGAATWFVLGSMRAAAPEPILAHESAAGPAEHGSVELADVERAANAPRSVEASSALEPLLVRVVDLDGVGPEYWQVNVDSDWSDDDTVDRARRTGGLGSIAVASRRVLSRQEGGMRGSGDFPVELPAEVRARVPRILLQATAYGGPGVGYTQSDPVVVDASTRGPITLVVVPPTILVVRVEGPRPAGDLRFEVAPVVLVPATSARGADFAIVPDGEASFRVAHGVPYHVRVAGPDPDDVVETTVGGIERGQRFGVRVRFPGGFADPLPPGYAVVALSGRIEFEGDDRPGLWATVDGGLPISIPVHADGHFELMHERATSVELHASGGDLEARFDPEVSTHPFGTRDVLVRSIPAAPTASVRLRFVAAEDGAPVHDAWVTFLVRDGERTRSRSLGGQNAAEVEVSLPALEDLEYFVCARDRRDERGVLFAAGAPVPSAVLERTLRLARGFRRDFRVVHCSLQTPVAGAEIALDALFLARSDADGRLRIELDEWPGRLTIRAQGFDEGQWPPAWQTPLASTTMTICPPD